MQYFCDLNRHLICTPYSVENLHKMAEDLEIKKCHFHGGKFLHYDITKRRMIEIQNKCIILSSRELLDIIKNAEIV